MPSAEKTWNFWWFCVCVCFCIEFDMLFSPCIIKLMQNVFSQLQIFSGGRGLKQHCTNAICRKRSKTDRQAKWLRHDSRYFYFLLLLHSKCLRVNSVLELHFECSRLLNFILYSSNTIRCFLLVSHLIIYECNNLLYSFRCTNSFFVFFSRNIWATFY